MDKLIQHGGESSPVFTMDPQPVNRLEGGLRTTKAHAQSLSKPFVTVVTVVLNCSDTLEKTIQSIIGQTYSNIEYILIDGGSTDGTLEIIKRYDAKIDFWLSEPDKGIFDAMNKGIEFATGEWINFMNAGDVFYDQNTLLNIFGNNNHGTAELIYGNHLVRYSESYSRFQKAGKLSDLWKGMIFFHQSSFTKLSLLKSRKFDINFICADFKIIYSMYKEHRIFQHVDETIAIVSAGGISDTNRFSVKWGFWNIVNSYGMLWWQHLYYIVSMIDTAIRLFLKKIFPDAIVSFLIKIKYLITK